MADLIPSTPGPNDVGRLSATVPLRPGWPCRLCGHPLSFVLNHQAKTAAGVLACCHCDNAERTGDDSN